MKAEPDLIPLRQNSLSVPPGISEVGGAGGCGYDRGGGALGDRSSPPRH